MFQQRLFRQTNNVLRWRNRKFTNWSPLAKAFNSKPNKNLFKNNEVGIFGVAELKSHEGFNHLQNYCIEKTDSLIDEALSNQRSRKMVEVFDELSDTLCQVADLSEFIRIAHPVRQYREAAEVACCTVSGIVEKLNTNYKLYEALKKAVIGGDIEATSEDDKRVGELFLFDFEQCGIHLSEDERQRVVDLNDFILNVGQRFVAGTSHPRIVKKGEVTQKMKEVFSYMGDDLLVTGLYTDSSNPLARKLGYTLYLLPDQQQDELLNHLLKGRHALAQACGFKTYSERALRGATVNEPAKVVQFLNTLTDNLWDKADNDFLCMEKLKKQETPNAGPLAQWDVPYVTKRAKNDWFRVSSKEYSPYFSLGSCMDGLNLLFQSLYGIELVHTDLEPGECWSGDVYKLSVVHENEGLLGYIYCDFYERTSKPNQDCHFTVRGGRQLRDGSYQNPIVVLMLNIPAPRWSSPSLLTPNMVDNLFHEMGHAMHSMLGRTKYQHVMGTRCSTDFAEVPSILMEYFASDVRVLKRFAKHFQTNESMSEDMLKRLCASKHLFTASETQLQVFYAALDQAYHGEHPLNGSTTDVLAETQKKYFSLPYIPNTTWQLRFSHLVGYGAKYYSYLVSRALAQLIWETYFEKDPFSRSNGELYRRECLAHGGLKDPKLLVQNFLQCNPTAEVLAKSLVAEIEAHQSLVNSAIGRNFT